MCGGGGDKQTENQRGRQTSIKKVGGGVGHRETQAYIGRNRQTDRQTYRE